MLLNQLQKPEFYPHPVTKPIQVIQTHISTVFLTGDYAYKVKKDVDFGFLDFSTLAKRKHFLEEELRLNQSLAPEIYLKILPITEENNGKLRLNGTGLPVEYVLKMRQFPQENLFINLFKAGKLTGDRLKELAKIVAKFHRSAPVNEEIMSFGTVPKVNESIEENYDLTHKYIGIAQTEKQYQETKAFTDQFLNQKKQLFEERQNQHKIRECHGDLHLKNICLWQDKIYLFDRIEFNKPFRFVDVMYDIAFTVMDLDARQRQDLGNIFLNTYLEETGDWEGLQVLPLYLSRQAYVRAKVTSFLLDDPNVSEAEKQEAIETAKNYYQLAWQYTQTKPGKLIMMSGLSGSGKTTIAQKIAQSQNGIAIRSDAVRKHLAGIPLNQRGDETLYTPEMTQKTYQRLSELGSLLAQAGYTVILDAKYDRRIWREQVIKIAQTYNLSLEIVYCDAPLDVLRDRLKQRKNDISDATPELLRQQQENFEPFTETEQSYLSP